jgi:penicillin-binding protein 1B
LRRSVVWGAGLFLVGSAAFIIYLTSLWRQLDEAFNRHEQFVPTRIYSDVTRIGATLPRAQVEERLRSLAYSVQSTPDSITTALHPIDYPADLVPANHPVLAGGGQPLVFHFDGAKSDALLISIDLGGREVPELYLEPELVATLSRGENRIRELVPFGSIPALMWKAIIAVEDQRFLEHKGLDPRGIARMIWVNLRTRSLSQGGSTITGQLVKNLMQRHGRNVFRKVNELFLALLLEARFDKEQILERYLNEVYLGQSGGFEIHGVSEGAEHFFGKKLKDLSLAEIALLAGVIRGPAYYSPYTHHDRAFERQRLVLKKMVETGQIAEAEAQEALKLDVHLAPPPAISLKAPYFTDYVKAELQRLLKDKIPEDALPEAGLRIYTTLDMLASQVAQRSVADGVSSLEGRLRLKPTEHLEGALASVDSSGAIRALVGGRSYARSTFNRILNMKRQVGSTFKPIVYLAAILKGDDGKGAPYGPAYPMEDAKWTLVFDHGKQKWTPRNYEKEFLAWIPLRTALANSVNTVTARLGWQIGIPQVVSTARSLGITSDLPAVPSLTLGVAELSPVELLRVYATIAAHGQEREFYVVRAIQQNDGTPYPRFLPQSKQAIDPGAADLLADMLTSVFTEGTAKSASAMGLDRPAAGKTGTTSHYRDAWFAGFTPQLTTVVWVGMDQDTAARKGEKATPVRLSGAGSALPIWVSFMRGALAGEPPAPFPISGDLVDVAIDEHTGKRASGRCGISQVHQDKYLRAREPKDTSCEPMFSPVPSETVAE